MGLLEMHDAKNPWHGRMRVSCLQNRKLANSLYLLHVDFSGGSEVVNVQHDKINFCFLAEDMDCLQRSGESDIESPFPASASLP